MKKTKEHKIDWNGRIENKEFSDILFEELTVKKADIKSVTFRNVHFKNCYLGFNSKYSDSTFIECKFYGKYSSLGTPAIYTNCRFENCQFIGIDLFTGQHFYDCKFSGLMKNPILNDIHPKVKNNETVFKNCDLTNLTFQNVSLYGKNVFENTILPASGIRLYDNTNDKLIEKAEQVCGSIESSDKIESEVIFRRNLKQGQNPIILDDLFLDSFFKTENSRKIFEKIVKGYELN
ncbi:MULTISPECIES: pentapeptide repeat-containing protein [unclassified Allomuricauda]|uniref:pentapeptide repeat-containing protein n=1 Tax=unclassified Allomuricauda TaxID=2615049 RepID=UPI00273F66C7|nr:MULTISPECIES: hypothetical protein [unclassified Allomuricauda]